MIKDNLMNYNKFIYSIINKYKYYYDIDDLYQVSIIGLLEAEKNYKDDMNTKFTTYAYFYIIGEIKKYIRDSRELKFTKEQEQLSIALNKAKDYLSQKFLREPTSLELALFLEIDENKIFELEQVSQSISSLDSSTIEDDETLYNKISYIENSYNPEITDLKNSLDLLSKEELLLIKERYYKDKTQQEVANNMNISQVKLYRMEQKILHRLKTRL